MSESKPRKKSKSSGRNWMYAVVNIQNERVRYCGTSPVVAALHWVKGTTYQRVPTSIPNHRHVAIDQAVQHARAIRQLRKEMIQSGHEHSVD